MTDPTTRFVICVSMDGYPASLETQKVYEEVPDPDATGRDLVRIKDESGGDYLFPRSMFLPIELSAEVREAITGYGQVAQLRRDSDALPVLWVSVASAVATPMVPVPLDAIDVPPEYKQHPLCRPHRRATCRLPSLIAPSSHGLTRARTDRATRVCDSPDAGIEVKRVTVAYPASVPRSLNPGLMPCTARPVDPALPAAAS